MNDVEHIVAEEVEATESKPYLSRPTKTNRMYRSRVARLARRGVKRIKSLRKKTDPRRGFNSLQNWRKRNEN